MTETILIAFVIASMFWAMLFIVLWDRARERAEYHKRNAARLYARLVQLESQSWIFQNAVTEAPNLTRPL